MSEDSLEKLIKKLRRILATKLTIYDTFRSSSNNQSIKEHPKSEKQTMLKYGKALSYVVKRTYVDATMVVANADCIEKGTDFFYKPSDLDNAIKQVRRYNG